jgi:hypothetical protein
MKNNTKNSSKENNKKSGDGEEDVNLSFAQMGSKDSLEQRGTKEAMKDKNRITVMVATSATGTNLLGLAKQI